MPDVDPIPAGYPRLMPYLSVQGAADAIAFYADVFGAKERMRMPAPDGTVGHAELDFGDSVLMLADESVEYGNPSPKTVGGTAVGLTLYVEDCDAVHARALERGATELSAPADQFYGDRSASFTDPFGHKWHVMTHVEDVTPEEMERRMAEMGSGAA